MLRSSAWLTAAISAALVSFTLPAAAARHHGTAHIPGYIRSAVASSARPQADRKRDAERKPEQVLAFSGIKPGDTVAELIPAAGYYTRLISKVVGSSGHDYMLVPGPPPSAAHNGHMAMHGSMAAHGGSMAAHGGHMAMHGHMSHRPNMMEEAHALASDPQYPNLSVESLKMAGGFGLPHQVDMFWTTLNYHDLHNIPGANMAAFNKEVYDALKPGGIYFVVDHAAAAGAGTSETRTLHRIDPAAAKREIEAAGFKFVGSSNLLRNPHDPHTKIIFDPSIRGHTDRFIFKFRKP
ncbi:MAG: class I SAM-dependent methyltransferase [Steroidobacteraceae bacterium]